MLDVARKKKYKILIVEDENIVALDIQTRLIKLGFEVVGTAKSGEEAIQLVQNTNPELVLMDVFLKGKLDGIQAAETISAQFSVPIVYLTAYADEATIKRAKITSPFGYVLKPFDERILQITIEMALYKHRIEEALKESEEWFRNVFDSSKDTIIAFRSSGEIILINPAAEVLFGLKRENLCNSNIFALINKVSHSPLQEIMSKLNDKQNFNKGYMLELSTINKAGWVFPTEASVSRTSAGGKEFFLAHMRDITIRKKAEETLQEALVDAESANRAKNDFLSNISHEIRTPMNSIIGMTELLSNTCLTTEQSEFAHIIEQSASSLMFLIDSILDFSKIEAGKIDLTPVEFNISKLLEDIVSSFSSQAGVKELELLLDIDSNVPQIVIGDNKRLQQVLNNLIGNAIKFTPTGEVLVYVGQYQRANLSEMTDSRKLWLHFSVRDTGIGIPEDKLNEVFESFTQIDSSYNRAFGGTGLGLTISKNLIELMQGEIWVESVLNKGSEFHFVVPLELPQDPIYTQPKKVFQDYAAFLIETNELSRRILTAKLQQTGFKVFHLEPEEDLQLQIAAQLDSKLGFLIIINQVSRNLVEMVLEVKEHFAAELEAHNKSMAVILLLSVIYNHPWLKQVPFDDILRKPVKNSDLRKLLDKHFGIRIKEVKVDKVRKVKVQKATGSVLIVDDDKISQRVMQGILELEGYFTQTAGSGTEALELLKAQRYDLILMDIIMPEMDGYKVIQSIKNLPVSTPIMAVTSMARGTDRENCLKAGATEYISKPLKFNEFIYKVNGLVNKTSGLHKKGKKKTASAVNTEAGHRFEDIKQAVLKGNFGVAEHLAANLKLMSQSIGNAELERTSFKLILAIRKEDVKLIITTLSKLEEKIHLIGLGGEV